MKKVSAVLLALLLCLALAACGTESGSGVSAASIPEGADITKDQLKKLAEAYNALAPNYNKALEDAEANGWMDDEKTAAELQALGATMTMVSQALTEDLTILNGADIDGIIATLESLPDAVQELADRVSEPYGE